HRAGLGPAGRGAGAGCVAADQDRLARGRFGRGVGSGARRVHPRLLLRGRARGHHRFHREAIAGVQGALTDHARLAALLRDSGPVVALTGAGISVPSGIPDFRTPQTGLWENVDPMEVAHISVWRRNPERFWSFYGQRFAVLDDKEPNGAHRALVELEQRG